MTVKVIMYEPRTETVRLTYLEDQELYKIEKPFQLFSALDGFDLDKVQTTNLVFKEGDPELIEDVRGRELDFKLNKQGFAFFKFPTKVESFDKEDEIVRIYLPEIEQLLRSEVEDVDQVYFFDWRIRKNVAIVGKNVIDANDKMQHLLPARHVHIDQAPSAVLGRVQLHLPDQADFLLKGRVRVINAWRPIVDIVEDRPLCLCDARSIEPSDLIEADHIRKHYNGANIYAKSSNHYKWYYLNQQRKEEITLFKNFDSASDVEGNSCLHTSFSHNFFRPDATPRESIEVRALVFSYPTNRLTRKA